MVVVVSDGTAFYLARCAWYRRRGWKDRFGGGAGQLTGETRADFLTEFANSYLNQANVNLVGLAQAGLGFSQCRQ
jgi:hypothetical protein